SGNCAAGSCQAIGGGTCTPTGSSCSSGTQCCSKLCSNGVCDSSSSYCRQISDYCSSNDQCCSGRCVISRGLVGTGPDPSIAGIGSCLVAGQLTQCTLQSATYGCNQACCSRSCGTSGTTAGLTICEQPSGCAPLGELCQQDVDCCENGFQGFPDPQGLRCSK